MVLQMLLSRLGLNEYKSSRAYDRYLSSRLRANKHDKALALAQAIGSDSLEKFQIQGDGHVAVLKYHGLVDDMAIFDLGCGSGRTAQALVRAGWRGDYTGTDIIERFVAAVRESCPGYKAFVHRSPSIPVPDASIDMLFHWSVFTHLTIEECYLYMEDSFRALKPGGKLVFSFIELTDPAHHAVLDRRLDKLRLGRKLGLLDSFLHRDWIRVLAQRIGFTEPAFTDGTDDTHHPAFWQALVVMTRPLS